jgi:TolA-binding protein
LWRAADCFTRAEDPRQAARALREYLRFEPIRRRAQALVNLGTAVHSLGDDAAALAAAQQCIDFHSDQASVYQARILASRVYLERKDLPRASAALEANLRDDALMPTSREWRDSLFLLGKLLFDEAQQKSAPTLGAADVQRNETLETLEAADDLYRTSLARLREAVARYPHVAESLEARYLVADGHRLLARLPRERLDVVTVQTTRLSLVTHMRDDLQAAVQGFSELQEELVRLQEEGPLTEPQDLLLRNAYFGRAAALFELEQYETASEAYADAASRYQQHPEALDALVQLAACYQRLARPAEARGALEQARIVWQQLPTEVACQSTTPFDREEWQRRLDWLEKN